MMAAIQTKRISTMNLLGPVTQVNLGRAIIRLVRDRVELATEDLRQLRAAHDNEAAIEGFLGATIFGSSEIKKIIAENMLDHSILEANKEELWVESVKSDSEATVSALLYILPH